MSGKGKIALLREAGNPGDKIASISKNQVQTPQALLRDYEGKEGQVWTGEEVSLYFQKWCSSCLTFGWNII